MSYLHHERANMDRLMVVSYFLITTFLQWTAAVDNGCTVLVGCDISSNGGNDTGGCDGITETSVDSTKGMQLLLGYCLEDERCTELYGMLPTPDINVFAHLFKSFRVSSDMPYDFEYVESTVKDMICNKTMDDVMMFIWILIMRYNAVSVSVCSVNERFILTDPESGTGGCVCMPDKTCYYEDSLSNLLIALMFIIIILLLSVIVTHIMPLDNFINSNGVPSRLAGASPHTNKTK